MGTNFYLHSLPAQPCPHCGHVPEHVELHIGKSSAGWFFALRVYPLIDNPTDGTNPDERLVPFGVNAINELDDWRPLFEKFEIRDEYGRTITAAEMISWITERSHPNGLISRCTATRDQIGPYGDLNDCKPGKGTYDLCAYEFS